jgi:hypothetical protein
MSSNPTPTIQDVLDRLNIVCPCFNVNTGAVKTMTYLGTAGAAVDKAIRNGQKLEDIVRAVASVINNEPTTDVLGGKFDHTLGWERAGGEQGYNNVSSALGLNVPAGTPTGKPKATTADISGYGNRYNASHGDAFLNLDGVTRRLAPGATPQSPDAAYVADRDALLAKYPLDQTGPQAPAVTPWGGPEKRGGNDRRADVQGDGRRKGERSYKAATAGGPGIAGVNQP